MTDKRTGEKMRRRGKRKKRIVRLGVLLLLVVILAAAALIFRVGKVTVYGNTWHSSEEISDGLVNDLLSGNSLYLLWKYKDGEVPDTLPFLSSIHVQLQSPSQLQVQVTEKQPVGYVDKGSYVYFDNEGTVLEITDEIYEGMPVVTGVSTEEPVLYQKLPAESSAQLRTILSLTQLLNYHELNASEIRFGDNMEITVYIDGVEVELGQDEYLEEKIANLKKIMERLEGQWGTLHLDNFTGRNETVSFTPSDEAQGTVNISRSGTIETEGSGADGSASGTETDDSSTGTGADSAGADGTGTNGNAADGTGGDGTGADPGDGSAANDDDDDGESVNIAMVFNSSGTLVYNVHVSNGTVVDSGGNPVPGVTIDSDGYIVDAYMNRFDPNTGELVQ